MIESYSPLVISTLLYTCHNQQLCAAFWTLQLAQCTHKIQC